MLLVFDLERYLHSNYGVYEEKHSDEKTDVRKSLLEKRQQRQVIQTCHGGKNTNLSYCLKKKRKKNWHHPRVRNEKQKRGDCQNVRPWKIARRSTAVCGWCNPASAAWSTWPLGKASGNSCWWCSPTRTDAQAVGERVTQDGGKESESGRQTGETGCKTQMVKFITIWLKLCLEAGIVTRQETWREKMTASGAGYLCHFHLGSQHCENEWCLGRNLPVNPQLSRWCCQEQWWNQKYSKYLESSSAAKKKKRKKEDEVIWLNIDEFLKISRAKCDSSSVWHSPLNQKPWSWVYTPGRRGQWRLYWGVSGRCRRLPGPSSTEGKTGRVRKCTNITITSLCCKHNIHESLSWWHTIEFQF